MSLKDQIRLQNDHWREPLVLPKFRRSLFPQLVRALEEPFITTLVGPRRVGKTTLLKQLMNHIIEEERLPANRVLYFSLDLYSTDLLSILNTFREEVNASKNDRFVLIFDEIQYLPDWASHVKLLYDNLPKSKILISGSSSTELHRGKESLAGREVRYDLPPLSFAEYLNFSGRKPGTEHLREVDYMHYMDHQLPDLVKTHTDERKYVGSLVDKVIDIDMRKIHNIKDTTPLNSIFSIISQSPGEVIIARDLGSQMGLDARTVKKYLMFLEQSLLIRKLYNFSGNARKTENRHKRYYPYYTTLHWYTRQPDLGRKAETEVAFQLEAEYFFNNRGREIDFIVGKELDVGVEVKMRNNVRRKHLRPLIDTHLRRRFVVTKHETSLEPGTKDAGVTAVPLHRTESIRQQLDS